MTNYYVKFTEDNEHEGELWRFWLPIDGNEVALFALARLLDEKGQGDDYELDMATRLPERDVDVLVSPAADEEGRYMPGNQKVTGTLSLSALLGLSIDKLYKGGIRDLFT